MALLKMDGFDEYIYIPWKWPYGATNQFFSTGVFGYGRAAQNYIGEHRYSGTYNTTILGFHYVQSTFPNADSRYPLINVYMAGTNNSQIAWTINELGQIQLWKQASYGGSQSAIITTSGQKIVVPNMWYWFSFKYVCDVSNGLVEVYVNGELYLRYVGNTSAVGSGGFNAISLSRANNDGTALFDNLFIMDDTGDAPFNDHLPETRIYTVLPNSAGDLSQFTPVGSANNYQNVNVNPLLPTGHTVYDQTATPDSTDTFNHTGVVVTGTPQVLALCICMMAQKTDSGTCYLSSIVRYLGISYDSGAFTLNASWFDWQDIMTTDPRTGLAWGLADINNYQFGYNATWVA
jgi:hypothetical protein